MIPEGYVVLARLGAAHGLRGEVRLEIRTDSPERLAAGSVVRTDDPLVGELTIDRRRTSGSSALIGFAEVSDRTDAEAMTGLLLIGPAVAEEDAWYPSDLLGLSARGTDGQALGEIVAVREVPAHHLLVLREPSGARTEIPFVAAIVPTVDVAGGFVVLDPPGGLLADEPLYEESGGTPDGVTGGMDDRPGEPR